MSAQLISLPEAPAEALALVREASRAQPVWVFKKSPTCPISHHAEAQYRSWLAAPEFPMATAEIDVIAERPLARGLTELLNIEHQSPQALLFAQGELFWHESHMQLNIESFTQKLSEAQQKVELGPR